MEKLTARKKTKGSVKKKCTSYRGQGAAQGDSITTPLFRINASITGVFNDPEDDFDPERHTPKQPHVGFRRAAL
ncbi:DNA-binding domain-containing protein [Aliifodinibius sp. S!AR15-10]|uniref:DNA-binding domain-containing protein n=1 Tax=Aliifodinibius sp. S!AR15-10 TaxID=2950437 RepID=UPI00286FD9F3|nr:DNA-binding domain-containing protein [Aliifodinibius sp. S!AR15-10]